MQQVAVEDGKPMYAEIARCLAAGSDSITDPAYEVYHALFPLAAAKQLSEPGQKTAKLQGACKQSFLEGQQAGVLQAAGLPRPDPPANPKVGCHACNLSALYSPHTQLLSGNTSLCRACEKLCRQQVATVLMPRLH